MEKLEFFNSYKREMVDFFGYDIEFIIGDSSKEVEFYCEVPSIILSTFSDVLKPQVLSAHRVLENYYEENKVHPRYSSTLLEEISIDIIRYLGAQTSIENIYKFVQSLKEISLKTYENESVSLGIIYFPQRTRAKTENRLNKMKLDYIPFDDVTDLKTLIDSDKLIRKIIDGKSLALVVNDELKVTGLAKKRKEGKSIKQEIFSKFDVFEATRHELLIKSYVKAIFEDSKQKLTDFPDVNEAIIRTFEESYDIPQEAIERFKKSQCDYHYIDIENRNVNWNFSNNYMLTHSEGGWKLRDYNLLLILIVELLYLVQKKLFYLSSSLMGDFDFIKDLVAKVSHFVNTIKGNASENIGSLFIILKEEVKDMLYRTRRDQKSLEIYNKKFKELLRNEGISLKFYEKTIRDGEYLININDMDNYYLQLISSVDGAVILDPYFNLISYGEMIKSEGVKGIRGARSSAALGGSKFGLAIKVSEDSDVTVYWGEDEMMRI
ncbi:hypothetical protein [Tumebacillus avium]|uniref:hypothetical protein n=1 Tax=Tumebacillus avium TaxID=1903704 RepID=UPI0012FDA9D4|nr:hypothetical protein [Tumebacillus avium]